MSDIIELSDGDDGVVETSNFMHVVGRKVNAMVTSNKRSRLSSQSTIRKRKKKRSSVSAMEARAAEYLRRKDETAPYLR